MRAQGYCDTEGVEYLVLADGDPLDMTDWADGISAPAEKLHRFVRLNDVPAGAVLRIEAYSGHTMYGTMPYDGKTTFGWSKYRERCVFHGIYAVVPDEELHNFLIRLRIFLSYYRDGLSSNRCAGAKRALSFGCMNVSARRRTEHLCSRGNLKRRNAIFWKKTSARSAGAAC